MTQSKQPTPITTPQPPPLLSPSLQQSPVSSTSPNKTTTQPPQPSKAIVYLLLLIAVTTCSSAGVVFDAMTNQYHVPPFLAASWRLICQLLVLTVPFVMNVTKMMEKRRRARVRVCMDYVEEWNESMELLTPKRAKVEEETLCLFGKKKKKSITDDASKEDLEVASEPSFDMASKFLKSLPLMILSGVCLGIHFSSWVYSIEKTSLVHSLLWVSMGPILLNWGQWILFFVSKGTWVGKPSMFESWGAFIGLIGALVMLLDVKQRDDGSSSMISEKEVENINNPDPTLEGDVAAFLGAFAVSMYLVIGGNLRSWLPTLIDPSHPAHWVGLSSTSIFGFLGTKQFLGLSLYLGAGPGVCGHTLLSALLKYISPLTISTAMLLEPLLGSIMGYFLGMQSLPGTWTWVGGFVLLFGLLLVVLGGEEKEEQTKKQQNGTTSRDDLVVGEEDTQLLFPALDQDVIQKEHQSTTTANVHHHEQYGTMHSKENTIPTANSGIVSNH